MCFLNFLCWNNYGLIGSCKDSKERSQVRFLQSRNGYILGNHTIISKPEMTLLPCNFIPCNYHQNHDIELHHHKDPLCYTFIVSHTPPPHPLLWWNLGTTMFSISIILSFQESYTNKIIKDMIFWDCLFYNQHNVLQIYPSCYML